MSGVEDGDWLLRSEVSRLQSLRAHLEARVVDLSGRVNSLLASRQHAHETTLKLQADIRAAAGVEPTERVVRLTHTGRLLRDVLADAAEARAQRAALEAQLQAAREALEVAQLEAARLQGAERRAEVALVRADEAERARARDHKALVLAQRAVTEGRKALRAIGAREGAVDRVVARRVGEVEKAAGARVAAAERAAREAVEEAAERREWARVQVEAAQQEVAKVRAEVADEAAATRGRVKVAGAARPRAEERLAGAEERATRAEARASAAEERAVAAEAEVARLRARAPRAVPAPVPESAPIDREALDVALTSGGASLRAVGVALRRTAAQGGLAGEAVVRLAMGWRDAGPGMERMRLAAALVAMGGGR
jgi:hypothetical protein